MNNNIVHEPSEPIYLTLVKPIYLTLVSLFIYAHICYKKKLTKKRAHLLFGK
jgi:hypothetical protein